jgi:hypothetical protein
MKIRTKAIAGAAALCLFATLNTGCEDTGITAPAGSTITVIASPASVSINQETGETFGTTTIVAQLLGEGGEPLQNVPLLFNSTGGLLGSVDNFCLPGQTCSRSPDMCLLDSDCPFVAPTAIDTDNTGIALDILTLRLIEDPQTVDVTVNSTSSSTTVSVSQIVNTGPIDPVANIVAIPPSGQRTGASCNFDGTGSTFDPLVNITCWEWTITSSIPANNQVIRGPNESIITLTFGAVNDFSAEQDLSVQLRISDLPNIPCDNASAPPAGAFSPFSAVLTYRIQCDFTNPLVQAGNNQFVSLAGLPDVSVNLSATGSDPEDPNLNFFWNCGNGVDNRVPGQSVSCTYDTTGVFTATVTAENACGLQSQDSLTVTVNP